MQTIAADTNESFKLTISTERNVGTNLLNTQVQGVHVLEAIEQSDELRDRPVQVLCQNCGEEAEQGSRDFVSSEKSR